mgnify:CR=1 FL=1
MKTENGEDNVDLLHRRVLVTGGGSGLGRVLAVEFANTGAEVHVCGRRREPLDDLASTNGNIIAHQLDVTDEDGTVVDTGSMPNLGVSNTPSYAKESLQLDPAATSST